MKQSRCELALSVGRVLFWLSRSADASSNTSLKAAFDREAATVSVCIISSGQLLFAFVPVNIPQNLSGFWSIWKYLLNCSLMQKASSLKTK